MHARTLSLTLTLKHIEVLSNHNCLRRWKKSNKNTQTVRCEWIKSQHIHKTVRTFFFCSLKIRHAQDFYERRLWPSLYIQKVDSIQQKGATFIQWFASFIVSWDFRYKLLLIIVICPVYHSAMSSNQDHFWLWDVRFCFISHFLTLN